MSREEQIYSAACNEFPVGEFELRRRRDFERGAKWADENPESKYNVSDPDFVKCILEGIIEELEHTTTGNLAHNIASIKYKAKGALKVIKEIKK